MSATLAKGSPPIDPLRRPTAPGIAGLLPARWSAAFDEAAYRHEAARSNADLIPRPLAILLHMPPEGHPERLMREIELVARLFDRDRDATSLHVDATGTGIVAARDLEVLARSLDRHFHFGPQARRRFVVGVSARALRRGDLAACASLGFEHVRLAEGSAGPDTGRAIELARREGMHTIAVDAPIADHRAAEAVVDLRPDAVTFMFPEAATFESAWSDLEPLAAVLAAGGYRDIGLDHRALPWLDAAGPLRLSAVAGSAPPRQPDVQVDQVGLGIGAVSRIHDAVSQNFPDAERWQQALDAAGLPVWRGHVLDADEQLRMDVIGELLRTGAVSIDAIERRYGVDFHQYFSQELERLHGSFGGLIASTSGRLAATSQGHLALRIMAACFDRTGARPPP